MTDKTTAETVASVQSALETLLDRLEREYAWVLELREDIVATERTCQRLLTSCDAAIQALPQGLRGDFLLRCARIRIGPNRVGKPPQDGRQRIMVDFLAGRLDDTVTTAEIRLALESAGYKGTPAYISNQLGRWGATGMVTRLAPGVFKVNPRDNRLRAIRFRDEDPEVRQEIATGRAQADARFDTALSQRQDREKAEEYEKLRRRNFYRPRGEWDPPPSDDTAPSPDA